MNTHQPPDWTIHFEDGTTYNSGQGSWSDVAELVTLDGVTVYQTIKPVEVLVVSAPDVLYPLCAPFFPIPCLTPRPYFAHKRWAMSLSNDEESEAQWLYTCFGYIQDEYRATVTVSPLSITCAMTPRSTPFTL